MSQYSRGYEQQPHTSETSPNYAPEPIDLQQLEGQQHYQQHPYAPYEPYAQSSSFQEQVPPQQMGSQPGQHYTYVQHVYVYPQNEPSSMSKFAALMSYLGLWFSGLMILLFVRDNRFVRFHALQSFFLFGGMTFVYIAFFQFAWFWFHLASIWRPAWLLFALVALAFFLLNVIAAISWFVGIGGAMAGKYLKLPFVGDLAEKLTRTSGQPR